MKIAFSLQSEEILDILDRAHVKMGRTGVGLFFPRPK
ncbi:MAG: hypothetical protein ACE5FU_14950 [Nitrospinota bacterium]